MRDLKFVCEEWRDIPEFEGYQVSSLGKVRGVDRLRKSKNGFCITKGRELKQVLNKKGYPEVRLRKNGCHTRLVHKLVASAFMTKPEGCTQINHINGIKTDNQVSNLEWVTNSQNQKHAYLLGLQPSRAGENNSRALIKNEDVTNFKILYNSGKSIKEACDALGIKLNTGRQIIYGQSWKSNETKVIKRDDRFKPITKI